MQYTRGLFLDYFVNKGLKFFYHYISFVTLCFPYCAPESRVTRPKMLSFYSDKASQLYSLLPHILIVSTDRRIEKYRLTVTHRGALF